MGLFDWLGVLLLGAMGLSFVWNAVEAWLGKREPTLRQDPYLDVQAGRDEPGWYVTDRKNPPKE
jgi:hypothetical protein